MQAYIAFDAPASISHQRVAGAFAAWYVLASLAPGLHLCAATSLSLLNFHRVVHRSAWTDDRLKEESSTLWHAVFLTSFYAIRLPQPLRTRICQRMKCTASEARLSER